VIGCGTGVITKFSKFGVDLDVKGNGKGNTYNESQFFNSHSGGIEIKEVIESIVVGGFEGGTSCFNINFLDKVPESIFVSETSNGYGPVPPVFNAGLNSRGPVVCCGDLVSCCGFYQYTNSCFAGGFQQGLLTSTIVLAFIFHIIANSSGYSEPNSTVDIDSIQTHAVWRAIFSYLSFTFSRYGYYKLFYLKNSKTIQLYLSNLPGSSNNISVTNFVSGTANLVLDGAYDCCETGLGGRRYTGALNASGSEIDTSISLANPGSSDPDPTFDNTILDQKNIPEANQYFGTLTLNIDIPGLNTCN